MEETGGLDLEGSRESQDLKLAYLMGFQGMPGGVQGWCNMMSREEA